MDEDMNKRPSTQFYPGDWWRAVDLRKCCMVTQGCWFNMLLVMWDEKSQGKITGTRIEVCRVVGCSLVELRRFFDDNKKHHFADVTICNKKVTIINRRMHTAFLVREDTKQRVKEYRKRQGNRKVMPPSSTSSSSSTSNTYTLQQCKDAALLAGLTEKDAEHYFNHFNSQGWKKGNDQSITNLQSHMAMWRLNKPAFEKQGSIKTKLFPIAGKVCGKEGCKMPAVYKDTSGSYDSFACTEHMPEKVKKTYE